MSVVSSELRFAPALALLCALLGASPLLDERREGEYGLYVHVRADSLVVQWLTRTAVPGLLEATWQGGRSGPIATPPGIAHRAAMPRPRREDVLLHYGAEGGPQFETRVLLAAPRRPAVEIGGVDSLYVVGDTHGDFDPLVKTLRAAGLVGDALQWTGGRRHLVFAGDLVDRGPYVTRLLWLVYRLEREAARAGGRVHVVLGNHEPMAMTGDLRYVHPRELELAAAHGQPYDRLLHADEAILGRWLASKPGAIRVDRALIAHGGIVPEYAHLSLRDIDRLLARFMEPKTLYRIPVSAEDSAAVERRDGFFFHPRSLFWYREYVQSDSVGAALDSVLHGLRADLMIVGHTATPEIQARYGGRLITAHTPRLGGQLLLLVRDHRNYRRYRIGDDGVPQPF